MKALTLYYFKVEANTIDDLARYWSYIEELESLDILPVAQVPFSLNNSK